jgi:plasmid maintenance system antidote protein VapI
MLVKEFLRPLGITRSAFASRLGVSFPRLNEIINAPGGHVVVVATRVQPCTA